MNLLHVKYFKYVAANGNLAGASEHQLVNAEVSEKIESHLVERILSDNKNPADRYRVGYGVSIKGVLSNASQADKAVFFGGTVTSEVYTRTQGVAKLAKYDLRLAVIDADTGLLVLKDYFDMQFIGNEENSFKEAGAGISNIAFEAMSTSTTDVSEDASAL